ncbi:MAG: tRNA 4-thiouridine(8) synthase ThiI [Candidatus Brocadiae bacterium]|nr:tRNA 4-thiouridine(8) synthase ThiI [Candidatus Brocadiia bacterium]
MDAVIHYAELGLKGKNRPYFEIRLAENVRRLLKPLGDASVRRQPGRLVATLPDGPDWDSVRARLRMACGVSYFARIHRLPRDIPSLKALLAREIPALHFKTFACRAHRTSKDFELTSNQINREIGTFVLTLAPAASVHLDAPDLEIFIEVVNREFLVYFHREPGPGGLPAGVSGKVMTLLSGGIDSPVAAWRLIRRGCRTLFAHFHSMPFTSRESLDKVQDLARRLEPWQGPSRLHLVPFGDLQQAIVTSAPAPFRIVLYRRFMMRIAEALARRTGALALVTGDSLGQVASQTLHNLNAVTAVAKLPVLRPLIGADKQEIVDEARRLGTYETSIQPHDDCCSFLMPRQPTTASNPVEAAEAEKDLDVEGLVRVALERTEEVRV